MEPFACHTLLKGRPAIIEIQTAGKKIAQHVGLGDLTFIIAVTSQGPIKRMIKRRIQRPGLGAVIKLAK
jgi:hypothetical protein